MLSDCWEERGREKLYAQRLEIMMTCFHTRYYESLTKKCNQEDGAFKLDIAGTTVPRHQGGRYYMIVGNLHLSID